MDAVLARGESESASSESPASRCDRRSWIVNLRLVMEYPSPVPAASAGRPSDSERERETLHLFSTQPAKRELGTIERTTIAQVLSECHWNRTLPAKRLGLTRTQLYLRLQKYGLEKPPEA